MAGLVFSDARWFQANTGANTQDLDFGVSWTPKTAKFRAVGATSLNSASADAVYSYGATDFVSSKVCSVLAISGASPNTDTNRSVGDGHVIRVIETDGASGAQLSFFASATAILGGVRLNWFDDQGVAANPPSGIRILATIYGGEDYQGSLETLVINQTVDATSSVTGVGFRPNAAEFGFEVLDFGLASPFATSIVHAEGFAVETAPGVIGQGANGYQNSDNRAIVLASNGASDAYVLGTVVFFGTATAFQAATEFTSFDADGITVTQRLGAYGGTLGDECWCLLHDFDDRGLHVGTTTLPATVGANWTETGPGFRPQLVSALVNQRASIPSYSNSVGVDVFGGFELGASGGGIASFVDDDGAPSQASSIASDRVFYQAFVGGTTLVTEADIALPTFTATGFEALAPHTSVPSAAPSWRFWALEEPSQAGSQFTLDAEAGSLRVTGNDAGLEFTRTLVADAGSLTLTGQDVDLLANLVLLAEHGALRLRGFDIESEQARQLIADAGSLALSGYDAGLLVGYVLDAESGSLALSGGDVELLRGSVLEADAGSLNLSGYSADLVYSGDMVGSATITIPAPGVEISGVVTMVEELDAESGSIRLTGYDAQLAKGYRLDAESGSLAISGSDAVFERGYVLGADSGSLGLRGYTILLEYSGADNPDFTLVAERGSLALSGVEVDLLAGRLLAADSGELRISGAEVDFALGYVIDAEAGSLRLTGRDVGLIVGRVLDIEVGSLTIDGKSVSLEYSGDILGSFVALSDSPLYAVKLSDSLN